VRRATSALSKASGSWKEFRSQLMRKVVRSYVGGGVKHTLIERVLHRNPSRGAEWGWVTFRY
jgi:hypothetical protein